MEAKKIEPILYASILVSTASVLAILTNLIIITFILRYKKLKTRPYIYVLNICIVCSLFNLSTIIFVFLVHFDLCSTPIAFERYSQIWLTLFILHILFITFLGYDACVFSNLRINKYCYIIFFFIYLAFCIECVLAVIFVDEGYATGETIVKFLFPLCFLSMIILGLGARFGNMKVPYFFKLALYLLFTDSMFGLLIYGILFSWILSIIWVIHPLHVFSILARNDKHFKIAVLKFFNRPVDGVEILNDEPDDNYVSSMDNVEYR